MTEQTTLHPRTSELVDRFAAALKEKLAAAEKKYGYSDAWAQPDWMNECRHKLLEHIAKGDPRDVAAYCAFLWHHGEDTAEAAAAPEAAPRTNVHRFHCWRCGVGNLESVPVAAARPGLMREGCDYLVTGWCPKCGHDHTSPQAGAPTEQLMRERTEGYVYARQQAADFVRSAGHPDLAASILLNWAPSFLPPVCVSCDGAGACDVFVQSGGSMPWNAGDGHEETRSCPDCKGEGLDYGATGEQA